MDWQIRLAIFLIGILLVGYIYFDYRRKKKLQRDNERLKRQFAQDPEQVDSAGFDLMGVGAARKVKNLETANNELVATSNSDSSLETKPNAKSQQMSHKQEAQKQEPIISLDQIDLGESIDDYILERSLPKGQKFKVQDEINSDSSAKAKAMSKAAQPELILTLILQADEGSDYRGEQLIPLILSQGLSHGEMGIFHQYQLINKSRSINSNRAISKNPSELTKKSLYSIANAFNPGSFDLSDIESIETRALAIFMSLPGPQHPEDTYADMIKTIQIIQKELGGKLLDENRSSYTPQTHNHRIELIKDYINKQL